MRPLALVAAFTSALAGLTVAAPVPPFDKIKIDMYNCAKGDKLKIKTKQTHTVKITVNDKLETDTTVIKEFDYIDEIIDVPKNDIEPSKVKRTYTDLKITMSGKAVDYIPKEKNRVFLIEKVKSKEADYKITPEGGDNKKLDEELIPHLEADFNSKAKKTNLRGLIPKGTVIAGTAWDFDPDRKKRALDAIQDKSITTKSQQAMTVSGRLVKAEREQRGDKDKKEEFTTGEIEITIKSPILGFADPDPIPLPGSITIDFKANGSIDGKLPDSDSTVTITLTAAGKISDTNVSVNLFTEEVRNVKKR